MAPDSPIQIDERPTGNLRVVGGYPFDLNGHLVTALPNGKALAYGNFLLDGRRLPSTNERAVTLRNRHRWGGGGPGVSIWYPLVWDPQQHGWKKIEAAPECSTATPLLHTATVLPGPKILFAGGLCEEPRMADDHTPRLEYKKLSLWNGATEKWEPAPVLEHGRVYHTASPLPDGSVLITGGESDPALFGQGEPVLASVESYADGTVVQMPDLHEARARHTATVNAIGEVLVAGGFGGDGKAITSVELWNPATHSWDQVQPMKDARYSHSATLLADGRILVAGGIGTDGRPLQSVEIWNPDSGEWTPGISLPQPLRDQGSVLLDNGNVLLAGGQAKVKVEMDIWAWLWDRSSGEWLPAGRSRPEIEVDLDYRPTFAKNPDGSVHIFSRRTIMQWRPGAVPPASVPPLWYAHTPVIAVLADGRVMTVGNILQPASQQYLAHIWNPKDNTWSVAGQLAYRSGMTTQALQLPSGRVMHLGLSAQNHLLCELWQPDDNSWASCGDLQLYSVAESLGLALLDDGRAVAITGTDEAHIFDERTRKWSLGKQKWNYDGMAWGAPIWQDRPLDTLTDEENREHDISPIAARFWGTLSGYRAHELQFSDRPTVEVPGRTSPPVMLWDPANKRWAYVLKPGTMGKNARLLPDGCAVSPYAQASLYRSNSFSMFNPATGLAGGLFNPGTGISPSNMSMEVLKDGTVVAAGLPEDADVTFFHRKASCAGWLPDADDWALMPGETAKPKASPSAASATTASIAPVASPSMRERLLKYRWLILAVVGPMALYVLLRFLILPLVRRGIARTVPEIATRELDPNGPKKAAWAMRIFVYGTLLVIVLPMLPPLVVFLQEQAAEECAMTACLNPENGLLEGMPSLVTAGARPAVPCQYVGLWKSTGQDRRSLRIILKDDGTYTTQPDGGYSANVYTGYWMVQGDKMVWRHNQGPYRDLDINQILPQDETHFELIEQNGWHTRFNLIEKMSSKTCAS